MKDNQNSPEGQDNSSPDNNNGRPKRPRIQLRKSDKLLRAIDDPQAFRANKCTPNGKPLTSGSQDFHYDLWIDQHYQSRSQLGDDFGKRTGIEPEQVESLIKRAFVKLMLYSASNRGFMFINMNDGPYTRVLLIEDKEDGLPPLNVIIEAHFMSVNKFEITVITALRKEAYKPYSGEYALELFEGGSTLSYNRNGSMQEVAKI